MMIVFTYRGLMSLKIDGHTYTPKEFAKTWLFNNLLVLQENADKVFEKHPEKYSSMTEREKACVKEGIDNVINTIERCLGLEKVRAKKGG